MLESYRPLIRLWAAILSLFVIGVATLQLLGPPAARALRQDGPLATPPPPPPRADKPVAAASLPSPVASDLPALGPLVPPVSAQPIRRRSHSWVRRTVAPARVPGSFGDDGVLAERGEPRYQPEPLPQDRDAPRPATAPVLSSLPSAYQNVARYIGVFTTGADGTRVFKAAP